ncbi:MAG: hypothetical protein R3C12_23230 [Planctomycetaceae bacterium]
MAKVYLDTLPLKSLPPGPREKFPCVFLRGRNSATLCRFPVKPELRDSATVVFLHHVVNGQHEP